MPLPLHVVADLLPLAQKEPPPSYVQDEQKIKPHDPLYPPINLLLNAAPHIPCTLTAARVTMK